MAYTSPCPPDMSPEAGQPCRLHLLQALINCWGDPDKALLPFLQHGVCLSLATQPAMAGQKAGHRRAARSGDWKIAEACEKWPLGIAVGKLNVVFAEGKELHTTGRHSRSLCGCKH